MVIAWNTGLAAERARHNLKLKKKKKKERSAKLQAPSVKLQAQKMGTIIFSGQQFQRGANLTSNDNRIIREYENRNILK